LTLSGSQLQHGGGFGGSVGDGGGMGVGGVTVPPPPSDPPPGGFVGGLVWAGGVVVQREHADKISAKNIIAIQGEGFPFLRE